MKLIYAMASAALMAISALSAQAAGTVTMSISPEPGEYESIPTQFVLTVEGEGLTTVAKNTLASNPLVVKSPDQKVSQGYPIAAITKVSDNVFTVTCNIPSSTALPLDAPGDYLVSMKKDGLNLTWDDETKSKTVYTEWIYTVKGNGGGEDDTKKEVAYDIQMIKTIPVLTSFNLADDRVLNTLQIYFDKPHLALDPAADATVTITGPGYKQTVSLLPNMDMNTATVFKAEFSQNFKYSGTYVMTIPQGILGDETWIEDHQYGHANAAVSYEFTVTGGEDPSTMTGDFTFNPVVKPGIGSKVNDLSTITLTFDSTPYFDATVNLTVNTLKDQSSDTPEFVTFGTATLEKGEGNTLVMKLTPAPSAKNQYFVTIPEGIIWNEAHEADNKAGALNGELEMSWYYNPPVTSVSVTNHIPESDAYVASFAAGAPGIVIECESDNAQIAKMDVEVIEYELGNDAYAPKTILKATSTDRNNDGYICWKNNTGAPIVLKIGYYYEVDYTLYSAEGAVLASGMFEFYGDGETGINLIENETSNVIINTQGIRVNGDMNALPAGLYIVNGKKIVIR